MEKLTPQQRHKKAAIQREQDDACISHAEREQSRTKCNYPTNDDPNKTPI